MDAMEYLQMIADAMVAAECPDCNSEVSCQEVAHDAATLQLLAIRVLVEHDDTCPAWLAKNRGAGL